MLEEFFQQIRVCLGEGKLRDIDRQGLIPFLERIFQAAAHFLDQTGSIYRGKMNL